MAANIYKRLERYYIRVIEDAGATKKEKADAASQLLQLKLVKTPQTPRKQTAANVLGSMPVQ
jgi:hypothetical protein